MGFLKLVNTSLNVDSEVQFGHPSWLRYHDIQKSSLLLLVLFVITKTRTEAEVCFQPRYNPLWLTGLKIPTTSLSIITNNWALICTARDGPVQSAT